MCGILGYTHSSRRLPHGVLEQAISSILHRGPDEQGYFVSEQISLAATRLRIQDLHAGDQPLRSPDGNVTLVFNGEIFNCAALRAELEQDGFRFQTHCDTEVVLNSFLRWGTACLSRLRGMFAFAIWVESEGRLLLARDPMGIKPLYYYLDGDEVYFGSELKAILAHPRVPRKICFSGLNCFLSLNYVPGPYTLLDGVRKLMPGHFLEWREGRTNLQCFVANKQPADTTLSVEEACDELDSLLTQAVTEQLVCDRPLGVWLSGGLDSSTVLHYAANAFPGRIRTFSVTFNGRSFDESAYIKDVSQRYNTLHTELDLSPDLDLAGAMHQMAYYSDEPGADAGAVPVWFLAQMTAQDTTVVLGGDGADELFGGYLTYKANRYAAAARMIPAPLRKAALSLSQLLPVSDDKIGFEYKVKRFLEGSLLSSSAAHVFWNGTFSEAQKRWLSPFADDQPLTDVLRRFSKGTGLQRFLEFDQRHYLADDILYKVDRMSMAHALEVRPPFLDTRIVEFANRLPDNFKLRGTTSKWLLRRLMEGKLPSSVLQRPKIGFDIPVHDWLRGPLRSLLLETLSRENVQAAGLFRWSAVQRIITEHLERKKNWGYHLWGMLVLLIWMKRWNVEVDGTSKSLLSPEVETLDEVGLLSLSQRA
jgi:asparagine synthase (glutamine-hydrolysing)